MAFNIRANFTAWGGGNQWLLQTARYLGYCGYEAVFDLSREVDCMLLTHGRLSETFGLEEIIAYKASHPACAVVHRVNDNDARKKSNDMDERLARFDAVSDHTVFISEWLRDHHAAKWFDRTRPHTCILNGADPAIFHPIGNQPWRKGQPLRLVTHHWSDNWMKGFAVYREIDELIAAGELPGVELWIIGRWPQEIQWKKARTFAPAHGVALAELLRSCHVYVTASLHEPGGMHFIEGLQCGLPLIYHEDGGGIVELGRRSGIGFREDVKTAIQTMAAEYELQRGKVLRNPPSGDGMAIAYREVVQRSLSTT